MYILLTVTYNAGNMTCGYVTRKVNATKVTSFSKNKKVKKGATVKFTAKINVGVNTFTYKFIVYRNGKRVKTQNSKKNYISYKIKSKGTYKIKVQVKNDKKNSATRILTAKVSG